MLGLILALTCAAPASRSDFQVLRVLYTSDMHGRSRPGIDFGSAGLPRRTLGGWDNLLRLIKEQRTDATLVLDCGDFGFGSPEGDSSQGRAGIEFMNAAGFDATAPGARDLLGGVENFEVLAKAASFPILSDPMLDVVLNRQVSLFRPYLVRDIMGIKLAVIGVSDPEIAALNRRGDVDGWVVEDPLTQLGRYLPAVRAESVSVIIVIGHLSPEAGCAIADSFKDVNLVICRGTAGVVENRLAGSGATPVLSAAAYGQRLGLADVLFSKAEHKVYQTEARMLNVEPSVAADSSAASAWIRPLSATPSDTAVCVNPVEYPPDSIGRLRLGTEVAEAVRQKAGADIAVLPDYVIESGLGSGRLGWRDLFAAVPYQERIRLLVIDDTTLAQLVAPESVGLHEPAPLLAGADYFVTGDTLVWPEVSQVGRARVRNRLPGTYRVLTTEQWLERARMPVTGKLLPQTLTDLWIGYAAAQETLKPVQPVRLYPATPGVVRQQTGGPVNINTADSQLLQTLPGIGPKTAERIIAYRETAGRFKSIEEIQDVKGIGPKKYEKLKPLITVK